jgi:hypothetical protein
VINSGRDIGRMDFIPYSIIDESRNSAFGLIVNTLRRTVCAKSEAPILRAVSGMLLTLQVFFDDNMLCQNGRYSRKIDNT